LWEETHHLLVGPSRDAALKVLQEFLETDGERLIGDPVKRAVLQRDLWAIFDWLVSRHDSRGALPFVEESQMLLRKPLAEVIRRLALDAGVIAKLPDTYAAAVASQKFPTHYDPESRDTPFLPPDLFAADKWVRLGRNGSDLLVPVHAKSFSRSSFQVFLNFPAGRQATKDYIYELDAFKEPFIFAAREHDGRFVKLPNPKLPQFPDGTQVALVRSALLIDSEGHLRATHLVESVQLRVSPDRAPDGNFEFVLSRARLFAGMAGGLNALGIDDGDFVTDLNPHLHDQIGPNGGNGVVRRRCAGCHRDPGIHSVNTFTGRFSFLKLPFSFHDTEKREGSETAAIRHKKTRYDWGLLEGLLSSAREPASPP
jgi:hypothetical protein